MGLHSGEIVTVVQVIYRKASDGPCLRAQRSRVGVCCGAMLWRMLWGYAVGLCCGPRPGAQGEGEGVRALRLEPCEQRGHDRLGTGVGPVVVGGTHLI